jgi:netrin receptor unc-5
MATVTSAGARLILPDAGVTLTIPEGALKSGQVQEFYLAVLREDRYRPKISGEQSVPASAFRLPHHDLKLQSPFNLTC